LKTSQGQKIARGTVSLYMNTNIPYRGKLYYSKLILNLANTFNLIKNVSKELKLRSNIAKQV
jgi:hypothetical protein